jgi:SAM-dependent methyltransferase
MESMTTAPASSPNGAFIKVWNDIIAPKANPFREVICRALVEHSNVLLDRGVFRAGDRVMDVGCGWGDTTLDIGRVVGPTGLCLGVDCAENLLAHGRQAARDLGMTQARFLVADAQTHDFEGGFDHLFSRFGTMFFQGPVAAMANLGKALKPGGKLTMLTWRRIEENDFCWRAKMVARQFLPAPGPEAQTCGPGPFSMASQNLVTDVLTSAGYSDIAFEAIDRPYYLGATLDAAIEYQMLFGPAGEIIREAGALGVERREQVVAGLRAALQNDVTPEGVFMSSSSWSVTAVRR